jgi:hypothetical protein
MAIAERNAKRRLVGCPGCNANFFRDVCEGTSVPAHYRVQHNTNRVGLCEGSGNHFKKAHKEGIGMA